MDLLRLESIAFWSALGGYVLVTVFSMFGLIFRKRRFESWAFACVVPAVLLHTLAIALRWIRQDHVPVGNAFEMLNANVWGLMVAVAVGAWLMPRFRALVAMLMPIIMMVMAWMLMRPTEENSLPPTYHTIWLYIHIGFIKLFLGCAFIALGLALIILARRIGLGVSRLSGLPDDGILDQRAYRFMALALIFDTLGVSAGAIWAQDAWGRYWSWDTLEVWSLVTWLSIGLTLHVRASFKTPPVTNALLIVGTFMVAFFTFFGIPFVSTALHKGQI